MLSALPAWLRYRAAWRNVRRTQEALLFRFLRKNAATEYGRRFHYARITSIRQFQEEVPVVGYDDLEPWIERICRGQQGVLTAEPVRLVEKTSGSSGSAKYIPYTESLLREFREALGAWMFDLFTGRPQLLGGGQYWSISPLARRKERTPGGLPVGIDDDAEYLGGVARCALRRALAVPPWIAQAADLDECRRLTLAWLMRRRDLRFISVWHPSFLTLLVEGLPAGTQPRDYWPRLQLISCWTNGASARFVPQLQSKFPGVQIQGKGLLATEGVVSFPHLGRPAPLAAITSHFLEFMDEADRVVLVDELEVGRRYRVLVTTGGGLARYALGDLVDVVAPGALEFVGRADSVSDLCGEKLSEGFVASVLDEASNRFALGGFILLAPEWGRPPRYLLFTEGHSAAETAAFVENALRASVHYRYCRQLGQLGPVEGVTVAQGGERYVWGCLALGQRAGDAKPAYLRRELVWRRLLAGGEGPLLQVRASHAG